MNGDDQSHPQVIKSYNKETIYMPCAFHLGEKICNGSRCFRKISIFFTFEKLEGHLN